MADEERPPDDTTPLRHLFDPVLDRLEKHSGPTRGPHREAFLDGLIKTGLVQLLPEITAWCARYSEHTGQVADGTTPPITTGPSPDTSAGDPSATSPPGRFPRPESLAAMTGDAFAREVALLPPDELARLAVPPPPDAIDVFDAEQRHVLDGLVQHNEQADVFEIEWRKGVAPGDIVEYEGRLVKMLGLATTEGMMRVAYAPPDARAGAVKIILDEPEIRCPLCPERAPFARQMYLEAHNRKKHPQPAEV